ncbi:MAG: hypothetical protein GEU75_11195 [Dehalococcoidia bacterium]|nr:hypothetical protein [Dehalococcoidia bacterium]
MTLSYAENTIALAEFDEAVEELGRDFFSVNVSRRIAGPMASGLFADPAVTFVLGALTATFLAELGKDVYRGLKAGLYRLYKAARTEANRRGYVPFAIAIQSEEYLGQQILLVVQSGLSEEEFNKALSLAYAALQSSHQALANPNPPIAIQLSFDKNRGWERLGNSQG